MQHTEITDLINESCVYNSTGFSGNRKLNIFTQFRTSQPVPHIGDGFSLRGWVLCLQFNRILGQPQTEHTQFRTSQPVSYIGDGGSLGDGLLTNRKVDGAMVHHTRVGFALLRPGSGSFRTRISANFSAGMCALILAI
jgi:hypothetical protein